jgi:D-amino-acid dehydrogenase
LGSGSGRKFLVVGGGIIGAASALRLQAAGFKVTLIDPGDARRGASFGNIGHIATEQIVPLAAPQTLTRLPRLLFAPGGPMDVRWSDFPLWGPWVARFVAASRPAAAARGGQALTALLRSPLVDWRRLLELAGAPPGLVTGLGHLVVWMGAEAAARGTRQWRTTPIGSATFREMTEGELKDLGAHLSATPAGGIRFSGSGQVAEPQAVRAALLSALAARGGDIATGEVRSLAPYAEGVRARLADGRKLPADFVLVAAGAWSGALMRGLGATAPLIGERGYSVQSAAHSWPEALPPVVFEERALVITRFISGLRASSFVELGRPGARADPRKWRRIERHLAELGIAFSKTPDRWMGPRPTLPDYLPAIGRLERAPRVLYAFGHQHLGLTLAALTAELIEALACDRKPAIDLTPFRIERFG